MKPKSPKIAQLHRDQRIRKRQIGTRNAELEKANESLKAEIAQSKRAANDTLQAEIDAREQVADILLDSEMHYRSLTDAMPVLIWQSGPDGLCTYFNNGWLEFTGRTLEQELGNGWAEGVHPEDLRRCLDTYTSAFERRESFVLEYRLRHRSGSYRWILDRGGPAYGVGENFLGFVGGCIDIHDRKLAAERLRRALAFNQAILANMGEGLYTLDTEGRLTYMNSAAERLFGWSSAELVRRKMHDAIHYRYPDGSAFPGDECPGLKVLQDGTTLSNQEDVFIRKDGTSFNVIYSSAPLKTEDGTTTGLVVVFHDVTRRKGAEEALGRSREELRALAARLQAAREDERTMLAREIHDELSGALTALKMDLFLLPERLAKNRNSLSEKLSSMSALIDRTLVWVRQVVTDLRPVVLDQLGLAAAIEWQTREFQQRSGIPCEVRLADQEISLDPGTSTAVFRIFQEALTNVARHAKATKVFIGLKKEAETLFLTVCDNGKGIDETVIHGHNSIGLLGMRERAFAFGGKTEITSPPNGGTLVKVMIPTNVTDRQRLGSAGGGAGGRPRLARNVQLAQ